ncbi:MAG: hypothetical protein R3C31_00930 [Hyphomonadaceae bacterium]
MQLSSSIPVTEHRLKRFAAWAMLSALWTAKLLFTTVRLHRRHVRQRWFDLDHLARIVAAILVVRAVQLHPIRRRPRSQAERLNAPAGCRRASNQRLPMRAIFGARLRKRLYAHDPFRRIGLLISVLRHLDAFADQVGARGRRGFTQQRGIMLSCPANDARPLLLASEIACADSS